MREFHRVYGVTAGTYVRKLRVDYVAERLGGAETRSERLAELAFEAGFSSHAHMTVTFKRVTGLTPSEFRVLNKAGSSR
jgi:AraC family transcriptional regulator